MYSYEIHSCSLPDKLVDEIDGMFTNFKSESGLAVKDYCIIKTEDCIVIKFTSSKPIDFDVKRAVPNNLIFSLIGKDQFFSKIYWNCVWLGINHEKMDIYFMSDTNAKHIVELDKYCAIHI